jgi:hypothetical protein
MAYRVASDLKGIIFAGKRPKAFLPHLVCSWKLDPASHRLSCAWSAPTDRRDIAFLPSRISTSGLRPAIGLAAAQA